MFKSKIDNIISKINFNNIDNKIQDYKSIYNEIILIKQQIKNTEFIKLENLPEIENYNNNIYKLEYIKNEINSNKLKKIIDLKLEKELSELSDIQQQMLSSNYLITKINQFNFKNNKDKLNKDILIIAYEIIEYNMKKRIRLKELYNDYHSQEFMKDLLAELYKVKISLLNDKLI